MIDKNDLDKLIDGDVWPISFINSSKFELFINSIPDAVIISNTTGQIIQTNEAANTLFKYNANELKELKIEDLVPQDVRDYHATLRGEFFHNPRPRLLYNRYSVSLRAVNKDKNEFPIDSSLFSIDSDQGKLAINILRDISDRKAQEEMLEKQAFYDELTKLPNRHYFNDVAKRSFVRTKRHNSQIAFLYIDLDKFKPVNDIYGHKTGDLLLAEVAQRITNATREGDFTARLGGDEFACILYSLDNKNDAISVCNRIIEQCTKPFSLNVEKNIFIGISIGIAFNNASCKDYLQLLQNADLAMYDAKNKGGNQHSIFCKI